MFAAKAGAKQVIGIDMSNILDTAQKIIDANGFTDSGLNIAAYSLTLRRDHPPQGQARGR